MHSLGRGPDTGSQPWHRQRAREAKKAQSKCCLCTLRRDFSTAVLTEPHRPRNSSTQECGFGSTFVQSFSVHLWTELGTKPWGRQEGKQPTLILNKFLWKIVGAYMYTSFYIFVYYVLHPWLKEPPGCFSNYIIALKMKTESPKR